MLRPVVLSGITIALLSAGSFAQSLPKPPINRLAPNVPSPQSVVEKMLEMASLKPGETVYDLGSGDGRVLITAAQKFGAKAVGIEISKDAVEQSRERIARAGLNASVEVVENDLLQVDLSKADVVTIYLLTQSNDLLRPNLEKYLKPGARVISHDYQIRGWKPVKVEKVDAQRRSHSLYLYEVGKK